MIRIYLLSLVVIILRTSLSAQIPDSLDYYPAHTGDAWQYYSYATAKISYTIYTDSVVTDSTTKAKLIYGRNVTGSTNRMLYKKDTSGNVYNQLFQSSYPRYKMKAQLGEQWITGTNISFPDTIPITATVTNEYKTTSVGKSSYVKVISFRMEYPPPRKPIVLGVEYMETGVGLIQSLSEGVLQVLSGAIIDGQKIGVIDAVEGSENQLTNFLLLSNYPNPFNSSTTIRYTLPRGGFVDLTIFDLLGRKVTTLVHEEQFPGTHEIRFTSDKIQSGTYFYRLACGERSITNKFLLLK